jgi:hypothetical protein
MDPSLLQRGRTPCGSPSTGAQLPFAPCTSQASHWPLQAVEQHTSSTQMPLVHWFDAVHAVPLTRFGTHTAAEQYSPTLQSASTAHCSSPHQGPLHVPLGQF